VEKYFYELLKDLGISFVSVIGFLWMAAEINIA